MKKCSKCNKIKKITEFNRDKHKKDGYTSQCKLCRSLYRTKNKHKINKYNREYYIINKDDIINKTKLYRKNNKIYIGNYKKDYYIKNIQMINEYKIKYRKNNKGKIKEGNEKYLKNNKKKLYNSDNYMVKLFRHNTELTINDIPQIFIEAKRTYIKAKRELRLITKQGEVK